MESTLPGTDIPCHDQWENILLKNDYVCAFTYGINRYYIDKQREHLLNRIADINQFIGSHELAVLRMQILNPR